MATRPAACLRVSCGISPLRQLALAAALGACLAALNAPAAVPQTLAPDAAPAQQTAPAPLPQVQLPQAQAPEAQPQQAQPLQEQPGAPVQPAPQPSQAPLSSQAPAAPSDTGASPAPEQAPVATDGAAPDAAQPQTILPQPILPEGAASPAAADAEGLPDLPSLVFPEGEEGLHDLSVWGMYQQADIVVKSVMIGLVLASLITWTVWLAKSLELFFARRRARKGLDVLRRSQTLAESEAAFRVGRSGGGTVPQLVRGALDEAQRSGDLPSEGIKERASILLSRIEARAGRRMSVGTGVLASIGSVAPFVGLFGTVWGIMNSFIGIAKSNTTNLAVVAPGIAEALLATAIGLVAAIPAVIIYNMFARSISGYRALLGDASAEVLRHLSRDLDRAEASGHRKPTPVTSLRSAAE